MVQTLIDSTEKILRACGGNIKDHKDDVHRLRQLLGKNGASIPKHYHHLPSFLFAAEIYYLYIRVKTVDPVPDLGSYFFRESILWNSQNQIFSGLITGSVI